LFGLGHRERRRQRVACLIQIVRVDDERFCQLAGCSRERAQHQHPLLIVARRDEFLGHQVHAVVQAAHINEMRGLEIPEDQRRLVMHAPEDDRSI
jgi:hypothetical protein